jgi:hypothetical protein
VVMFNGTAPPKTTNESIVDSLKPKTEIAAYVNNDSVSYESHKGTITWDAAVELFGSVNGHGPVYVPALSGSLKYRGLKVTEFTDLGYVGDPKRENNLAKQFSETHAYFDTDFPVKPAAQVDIAYDWNDTKIDSKVVRVGLAKYMKIGNSANLLLEYYPLSTKINDHDRMESEVRLSGQGKINDHLSVYGMGKLFNTGKDFTPLGKMGVKWNINDKWSLNGEYRNWPKVVNGKKSRDSAVYIGFARRFTDKR